MEPGLYQVEYSRGNTPVWEPRLFAIYAEGTTTALRRMQRENDKYVPHEESYQSIVPLPIESFQPHHFAGEILRHIKIDMKKVASLDEIKKEQIN